jgi:hypothetical protein
LTRRRDCALAAFQQDPLALPAVAAIHAPGRQSGSLNWAFFSASSALALSVALERKMPSGDKPDGFFASLC